MNNINYNAIDIISFLEIMKGNLFQQQKDELIGRI